MPRGGSQRLQPFTHHPSNSVWTGDISSASGGTLRGQGLGKPQVCPPSLLLVRAEQQ